MTGRRLDSERSQPCAVGTSTKSPCHPSRLHSSFPVRPSVRPSSHSNVVLIGCPLLLPQRKSDGMSFDVRVYLMEDEWDFGGSDGGEGEERERVRQSDCLRQQLENVGFGEGMAMEFDEEYEKGFFEIFAQSAKRGFAHGVIDGIVR